jgi:hypothetical protein
VQNQTGKTILKSRSWHQRTHLFLRSAYYYGIRYFVKNVLAATRPAGGKKVSDREGIYVTDYLLICLVACTLIYEFVYSLGIFYLYLVGFLL